MQNMLVSAQDIRSQAEKIKLEEPRIRERDLARRLGISEAAYLQAYVGQGVSRLKPEFDNIMQSMALLEQVLLITRGDAVVHEVTGCYRDLHVKNGIGIAMGDVDVRLFLRNWRYGFILDNPYTQRRSLQFFDAYGQAVHKVFATDETDMQAWHRLVSVFEDTIDAGDMDIWMMPQAKIQLPTLVDYEIKRFRQEWDELQDVHEFYELLKGYALDTNRSKAFELAGKTRAYRLTTESVENLLTALSLNEVASKIIVGNTGCIQIFAGQVKQLVRYGPWFNVLDPKFNLHLDTNQIDQVWLVKRPSRFGQITSVEAMDAQGETILTLFGVQDAYSTERDEWREIVCGLEALEKYS